MSLPESNLIVEAEIISFVSVFKNRAFCKMRIFVQNQGMRKILTQAYT
jgi:hypothetical protein